MGCVGNNIGAGCAGGRCVGNKVGLWWEVVECAGIKTWDVLLCQMLYLFHGNHSLHYLSRHQDRTDSKLGDGHRSTSVDSV